MSVRNRAHWERHVDQIIRSQHYTWLGEGLGGATPDAALAEILTDIMHICARQGISWENLAARSRAQFEREEAHSSQLIAARD
jgi:hypothetical protein